MEIFVVGKEGKVIPIMVDESQWEKGAHFSAEINGELKVIKHGGSILEGFYSGFETRIEAEGVLSRG
jgi:hypothetical protein